MREILPFARLTLRKNRSMLLALAGVYLASLPFGVWVAGNAGHPWRTGLDITVLLWCAAGLPLLAVLLGASTGAELRTSPARESEALLPGSHFQRALGAALGAAVQLAALAALVALTAPFLISENSPAAAALGVLYLLPYLAAGLLSSFACAFAFGRGVLGAGLGVGLPLLGLTCLRYSASLPWGGAQAGSVGGLVVAASGALLLALQFAGPLLALRVAAGWRDRNLPGGLSRGLAVCVLVFLGGIGAAWLAAALKAFG